MDITVRLRGKRIASITTNGTLLRLTMEDNSEMDIAWVDDNGRPIKGRPMVKDFGVRLHGHGIKDILRPDLLRTVN